MSKILQPAFRIWRIGMCATAFERAAEVFMFIQGDVLATILTLVGSCLSAWALTLAYGLLFPARSELARREISTQPLKCVGRGAVVFLTVGLLGAVVVGASHIPLVKLLGWFLLMSLFLVAALGLSGIAMNAGERLQRLAPDLTPYAAYSRGAAFLIVGCMLPLVGWFAFGPILLLAAIGAGSKAAFAKVSQAQIEAA